MCSLFSIFKAYSDDRGISSLVNITLEELVEELLDCEALLGVTFELEDTTSIKLAKSNTEFVEIEIYEHCDDRLVLKQLSDFKTNIEAYLLKGK